MSGRVIRKKRERLVSRLGLPSGDGEVAEAKGVVAVGKERKAERRREQRRKEKGRQPAVKRKGKEEPVDVAGAETTWGNEQDAKPERDTPFGDALDDILQRNLGEKESVPVLSKRRTVVMKAREAALSAERASRERLRQRREGRRRFEVSPDALDRVFERELRRVATRGVVALFNAVAQHQKAVAADEKKDALGSLRKTDKSGEAISKVRKDRFLQLLRQTTGKKKKEDDTKDPAFSHTHDPVPSDTHPTPSPSLKRPLPSASAADSTETDPKRRKRAKWAAIDDDRAPGTREEDWEAAEEQW